MIVDASAVVAIFKTEPKANQIEEVLENASTLIMASVTLTETVLAGLKIGVSAADLAGRIRAFGIEVVPVDESLTLGAAEARHRYPIRFGDGFVYGLAKARRLLILTLDTEFAKTDADLAPLS